MRLDSMVRLIAAADFMAFREIALLTLSARGYKQVELRDGWKDGGSDVSVWTLPPNSAELAVQVTVQQQGWKPKLKADAKKVAEDLGLDRLIFVTSRRIPAVEWDALVDGIWAASNVHVSRIDGQGIASLLLSRGLVPELLAILGIDTTTPPPKIDPKEAIRDELGFALSLLNPESRDFRRSVIEAGVVAVLLDTDGMSRTELHAAALSASGLGENQSALVAGAIDRMLQSGRLETSGGERLRLKDDIRRTYAGSRSLRAAQWSQLGAQVRSLLNEHTGHTKPTDADVEVILGALGGVLMATGASAVQYLDPAIPHAKVRESVRSELRNVHRVLDSLGFVEGAERATTFRELAQAALDSDLAYHLLAGQFYMGLAAMDGSALSRALGSDTPLTVVLDSSVAIPLLAALVYQETPQEWSQTAKHVYEQTVAHGLELAVPLEYIEETAAHLVDAHRFYRPLLEEGIDLRGSDNGFVSHFSALVGLEPELEFGSYLRSLGMNEEALKRDFFAAVDVAMRRHRSLLERYNVRVLPEARPSRASEAKANEVIEVASYDRKIDRPPILVGHDRRVIGYLLDVDRDLEGVRILCTWDNLHFYAREYLRDTEPLWDVLDPGVLGDLLASVTTGDMQPLRGVKSVVLALEDEQAATGSAIWDVIARLEGNNLFDGEILDSAREFKAAYFAAHPLSDSRKKIREAWTKWKSDAGIADQGANGTS